MFTILLHGLKQPAPISYIDNFSWLTNQIKHLQICDLRPTKRIYIYTFTEGRSDPNKTLHGGVITPINRVITPITHL